MNHTAKHYTDTLIGKYELDKHYGDRLLLIAAKAVSDVLRYGSVPADECDTISPVTGKMMCLGDNADRLTSYEEIEFMAICSVLNECDENPDSLTFSEAAIVHKRAIELINKTK